MSGIECTIHSSSELHVADLDLALDIWGSLLELRIPILNCMENIRFSASQTLFSTCEKLLWVTGTPEKEPGFALVAGLIRTVHWVHARDALDLVSLGVDNYDIGSITAAISRIVQDHFIGGTMKSNTARSNAEYRLRTGAVEASRIVKNTPATTAIAGNLSLRQPLLKLRHWDKIELPVRLIPGPAELDDLTWVIDTGADAAVKQRLGANDVTAVGSNVHALFPGDRVAFFDDHSPAVGQRGTLQARHRVNSVSCQGPDGISLERAAGIPIIFTTVIYTQIT
ncbi:hypothetical protein BDV12DRAFT_192747 [Aspergillus spectabilis]